MVVVECVATLLFALGEGGCANRLRALEAGSQRSAHGGDRSNQDDVQYSGACSGNHVMDLNTRSLRMNSADTKLMTIKHP